MEKSQLRSEFVYMKGLFLTNHVDFFNNNHLCSDTGFMVEEYAAADHTGAFDVLCVDDFSWTSFLQYERISNEIGYVSDD